MPVQVDHSQRREELAAAVWQIVQRSGINGLSVRAVGKEAGWTSGIVQHYFPTKNDLLRHAFELVQQRTYERLRNVAEHTAPEAAIEAAMLALLPVDPEISAESAVWLAFLGLALGDASLRETAEAGANELSRLMSEQVRRAQEARAIRSDRNADDLATELLSLADGLNVQALFRRHDLQPRALRKLLRARLADLAV